MYFFSSLFFNRILDPLLAILLDKSTTRVNGTYQTMYDARRVVYVFRVLKAIIECDFQLFMKHVTEKPAGMHEEEKFEEGREE